MKNLNRSLISKREPLIIFGLQLWRQFAVYNKVLGDYILPTSAEALVLSLEVLSWIDDLLVFTRDPIDFALQERSLLKKRTKLVWN